MLTTFTRRQEPLEVLVFEDLNQWLVDLGQCEVISDIHIGILLSVEPLTKGVCRASVGLNCALASQRHRRVTRTPFHALGFAEPYHPLTQMARFKLVRVYDLPRFKEAHQVAKSGTVPFQCFWAVPLA